MSHHEFLFEDLTADVDAQLTLEGSLPEGLAGTFYAIGGTGIRIGDTAVHGFDAHGRVTAVRFGGGTPPSLRARMVDTPLRRAELEQKKVVKRRLFTNKPARWSNFANLDFGNNAWHNVVPWGDAILAANDPGFFLLDRQSLATRGPAPIAPPKGATFSPMPHVDRHASGGRLVLVEQRPGLRDTLVVRELDDAYRVTLEQTYKLPRGALLLHDVAFTEHYYLVVQWASLSLPTALWGAKPLADAVGFDAAQTPTAYLLPRSGGDSIAVPLPGGRLHFHFWNSFEQEGKVVLDAIGYAGRVAFTGLYPPETRKALGVSVTQTPSSATYRYTIDPSTRAVEEQTLSTVPAESPAIREDRRGRAYRFGWAPTRGSAGDELDTNAYFWFHALARHDFEGKQSTTWDAGPSAFVSPPAFVPRPGSTDEDDGWVLALHQDAEARTSALLVFDARNIAAGPLARLRAPASAGLLGGISHVSFATSA